MVIISSIPQNVILIWTGTHASIPSGWTRETTLDNTFPKGWGDSTAPNQTGGAATHTHTSSAHLHSMVTTHTHTFQTNSQGWGSPGDTGDGSGMWVGDHSHSGTSYNANAANSSSDAVTYASYSSNPPFRKVIFIKAGAGAQLATDIVALWGNSDTAPSNWSKVTELADRYMMGASTGADSDLATNNGSLTNSHTITHAHTGSHTHGGTMSGPGGGDKQPSGGGGSATPDNHTHNLNLDAHSDTFSNNDAISAQTESNVEPVYRRLHAIKRGAYGLKEKGIIGMWLGGTTTGQYPSGWSLYTAMKDKHLKIGDPTTSATGGSNTHTHASQTHTHSISNASHNHTGSTDTNPGVADGCCSRQYIVTHSHSLTSVGSGTVSYNSATTTANSSSNEPAYRTVAFLKFEKDISGGGLLLFSMMT